jgi:hypothetical protein
VVSYVYDQATNAKGKLTSLVDQAGSATYGYDILNRLATEQRTLTGASKPISYEYNLVDSVKVLHYPSGTAVSYTPWNNGTIGVSGVVQSTVDNGNGINYATAGAHDAPGDLTSFISGNTGSFVGITNTFTFNKRLQPLLMSAPSPTQTVFSIGYDFHLSGGDNGNVYALTNNRDTTRNQTFTYDTLNRLIAAQNARTDWSCFQGHPCSSAMEATLPKPGPPARAVLRCRGGRVVLLMGSKPNWPIQSPGGKPSCDWYHILPNSAYVNLLSRISPIGGDK